MAMKRIGNVFLVSHYAVGDPRFEKNSEQKHFLPSRGIFISFGLIVRPEISWPGEQRMVDYAHEMINKLKGAGILTDEAIAALAPELWDSTFVACEVQFESLELAEAAFEKAINRPDSFVDIYLYQDNRLISKFD